MVAELDNVILVGMSNALESCAKLANCHAPFFTQNRGRLTLQPRQPLRLQPILRQHALNSPPQDLTTTPFLKHLVHGHALQATGPGVMRVVLLLHALLARRVQVVAAHGNDVVTAVRRRVVDGLVFAHEEEGDGGRDAAEGARVGAHVDMVPGAGVGEAGLLF